MLHSQHRIQGTRRVLGRLVRRSFSTASLSLVYLQRKYSFSTNREFEEVYYNVYGSSLYRNLKDNFTERWDAMTIAHSVLPIAMGNDIGTVSISLVLQIAISLKLEHRS